jgi:hypothetical protein
VSSTPGSTQEPGRFAGRGETELEKWQHHLDEIGITHGAIAEDAFGFAGMAAVPLLLQDIAALTLARYLHIVLLALRSGAYSPRLPRATETRPSCNSWPPSGEWSGQADWCASRD